MYEGRLVRLRAFEREDVDANHAFVNDYETVRGMLSGIPFPSSMQDEYRWLEQQTSYSRGEYQFAVEDGGGYLVGRCGVTRLDWKNRVAELAIMIGTPYRGRGYGSEAIALLCDFCFRERVRIQRTGCPVLREERFHPRRHAERRDLPRWTVSGRGAAGKVCGIMYEFTLPSLTENACRGMMEGCFAIIRNALRHPTPR